MTVIVPGGRLSMPGARASALSWAAPGYGYQEYLWTFWTHTFSGESYRRFICHIFINPTMPSYSAGFVDVEGHDSGTYTLAAGANGTSGYTAASPRVFGYGSFSPSPAQAPSGGEADPLLGLTFRFEDAAAVGITPYPWGSSGTHRVKVGSPTQVEFAPGASLDTGFVAAGAGYTGGTYYHLGRVTLA